MRQSQWECNDPAFFRQLFSQAETLFLSIATEEYPYVVPVNFVYLDGKLYFHSSPKGTKMELIARDGRVGFSVAADVEIARKKSTTYYKSVCGTGRATIVEDIAEKGKALDAIAERYGASCPRPTPEAVLRNVGIVRIDVAAMTGKNHPPHQD